MTGLLFFIISFCLVSAASYFATCTIKSRKLENSILYLILILVSQVIVSMEILSLFNQVTADSFLGVNFLIFLATLKFWDSKGRPNIDFSEVKITADKIIQALKKDRILLVIGGFFVFASLISLFFTIIVPSSSPDSLQYHLSRIGFWIQNHSLAHFQTPDVRQTIYPINSEIMILWSMIFLKRDIFAVFLQYFAYLGCIFVLFSYLKYLKVSTRRILWVVFIFASLPAVIIESSSTQTNLVVAFLLFASLYLFTFGIKENCKKALIFSAIAFSINLGVKYSVFFFVPVFAIIYLLIAFKERKNEYLKPLLIFISASIPAFLILSSYNYVLNYIEFGNLFGAQPYLDRLSAPYGVRTTLANLIRYIMLFIDFTGIKFANSLDSFYLGAKDFLFGVFGLERTDGLVFNEISRVNTSIQESFSKFGLLGFTLLLPFVLKYSFSRINPANRNKTFYISLTGLVTIGFILAMSVLMGFCIWNNRFLVTPIVLSSALFALSYTRKLSISKILISLVVLFNFIAVPLFNESKPFIGVCKMLPQYDFITLRNELRLTHENYFPEKLNHFYTLAKFLRAEAPDNSKIALIFSHDDIIYPFFEENPYWKLYHVRYERLVKQKNYDDYDFLVISDVFQTSEINNYKDVKFDYFIWQSGRVTTLDGKGKPVSLYQDRHNQFITSGKPALMENIINLKSIPGNFKFVKDFTVIEEPTDIVKNYRTKHSYIYKKMF